MVLCTYCGSLSISTDKCSNCGGHFDLLSRQRTQNGMGPWFIRDQVNPFHPGCSYDTLRRLVARGRVRPDTVMRGPTTRQFWSFARNAPGVAHLLGACHACHERVDASASSCPSCNASFVVANDRQHLGLAPMQLLPGDADPAAVADAAFGPAAPPREPSPPVPAAPVGARPEEAVRTAATPATPATRTARSPRKKSAAPLIAVTASVGCAVIALAAVVYMNRVGATTGAASASEGQAVPSQAEQSSALRPVPGPASGSVSGSGSTETQATPDRAQPRVESVDTGDDTARPGLGDIGSHDESRGSAVVIDEGAPDSESDTVPVDMPGSADQVEGQIEGQIVDQPAGVPGSQIESVDRSARLSIGTLNTEELADARAAWAAEGKPSLVRAAQRRLDQLELRALFGSH